MSEQSLRNHIALLANRGHIADIRDPVSVEYGVASKMKENDGKKAVHFTRVLKYATEIYGNLCCRRDFIAAGLGTSVERLPETIIGAIKQPIGHTVLADGACQEKEVTDVDLRRDLPILTHYERDGGPYIASAVVVARHPDTGRLNASYHRMMLIGRDRMVARLVEGRDLDRFYQASKTAGKPLEVAVVIGGPLSFLVASSTSPGELCELDVAGGLVGSPLETVKCRTSDLVVPRSAECVLEGQFLLESTKEGPFVDVTATYDTVRDQPILEVRAVTHREAFFYHALLPGGNDHILLMGMPKEVKILDAVRSVCRVREVVLSTPGSGWLAADISIRKAHPYDPYVVAMAAVSAHSSLKRVIVVDEDVDVKDPVAVDKAVIERAHALDDYQTITNVRGSSLDKSGIRQDGRVLPPAKLFIDATVKREKHLFETGKIPPQAS